MRLGADITGFEALSVACQWIIADFRTPSFISFAEPVDSSAPTD